MQVAEVNWELEEPNTIDQAWYTEHINQKLKELLDFLTKHQLSESLYKPQAPLWFTAQESKHGIPLRHIDLTLFRYYIRDKLYEANKAVGILLELPPLEPPPSQTKQEI